MMSTSSSPAQPGPDRGTTEVDNKFGGDQAAQVFAQLLFSNPDPGRRGRAMIELGDIENHEAKQSEGPPALVRAWSDEARMFWVFAEFEARRAREENGEDTRGTSRQVMKRRDEHTEALEAVVHLELEQWPVANTWQRGALFTQVLAAWREISEPPAGESFAYLARPWMPTEAGRRPSGTKDTTVAELVKARRAKATARGGLLPAVTSVRYRELADGASWWVRLAAGVQNLPGVRNGGAHR